MAETIKAPVGEKILTFQIGAGRYGVPVTWVCAVEPAGTLAEAKETCAFRGARVPVIDMADFFECDAKAGGSLLILGRKKAEAAALIDNPGVCTGSREVYKLPDLCQSFVGDTFQGVMVNGETIILMVDPERLCRQAAE
jgi:chemotaxis signal transduction protein